jgi:hypothetical protein
MQNFKGKIMQNSWYVNEDGKNYFFCKCGNYDVLEEHVEDEFEFNVKFNREEIDFRKIPNLYYPDNSCSVCSNEHYLDRDALLVNDKTIYWSEIEWEYEEMEDVKSWSVLSFLSVPKLHNEKVIFEKLELSTYVANKSAKHDYTEYRKKFFKKNMLIDGEYHRIDKIIKPKMSEILVKLITLNPSDSLSWLEGKEKKLENLLFFLENPRLRFQDILYWKHREFFLNELSEFQYLESCLAYILNNRSAKSLRKSQIISYEKMMLDGGYNPMVDYIFSRTINDTNHFLTAMGMNIEIKKKLFNGCAIENLYYFIDFLKRQYQEKHIVRFWLSIEEDDLNHYLLRDSTELFQNEEMRHELNKSFQKTPLNIRSIHHELIKYSREVGMLQREKIVFEYSDALLSSEVTKENITYLLPLKNQTLYEWGGVLHNCISSYMYKISKGESTIFGLFVEKKLTYAIELRVNKIVQASGVYNGRLSTEEREKIERWHKEVYLKNLMNSFNSTDIDL